jgi:hypothetical protein
MAPKIDTFLDRATSGLASDPELRLDVQAELRSHIEDKIAELGGDEHADEAVASLGEVVELAQEVSEANQRRLGWRNLARRLVQFGLVPLSIVCTLVFSHVRTSLGAFRLQELLNGNALQEPGFWGDVGLPKSAAEEGIILRGDPTRSGPDQYRTLWEQHPTNRVYYADYITHLLAAYSPSSHASPVGYQAELRRHLLDDLAEAQTVDPQNGRYPLLTAVIDIQAAAGLGTAKAANGKTPAYTLTPRNRPALDEAMRKLLAAVALPEYRRYTKEMLAERLDLLPPPTSLVRSLRRLAVAAGTLLSDLSRLRDAARYSLAYAQLLLDEGKKQEALPFLNVPEDLSRKIADDSFTLIDMVVVRAMINSAWETVPQGLRKAGYEATADATQKRLAAIQEPMQAWQDSRHVGEEEAERLLARRGGWLASLLLPALGGQDVADLRTRLAAGRFLEFTVVTQGLVILLQFLLLAAMLACLVISLRWRLTLGSQAAPLLLLPSGRDLARFVLLGIVLPFALFLAWIRWLPFSGHAYHLKYAGNRVVVELLALALSLLLVPAWLAARAFRRRCAELELPLPPRLHWAVRALFPLAGLLLVAVFLVPPGASIVRASAVVAAASGGVVALAVLGIVALSLFVARQHGRTVGTLSRSLIPVFAVAILLLSAGAMPLLRLRERQLLGADTILGVTGSPGFSQIENQLTTRLRQETLQAMAENPMPAGGER